MFDIEQNVNGYLSLVITHECNLKCPFCIDRYRGQKEYVTRDTVLKAIKFAQDKRINDILLVGGEPTLHPWIVEIVQLIKNAGIRTIMTSNGTKPNVLQTLDGLVDCFNFSAVEQSKIGPASVLKTDSTISALIHRDHLGTREELDEFITRWRSGGRLFHLKFSTLTACNQWTEDRQKVEYLNDLPCNYVVLFNEMIGQLYGGHIIKRYDLIINNNAEQSWKCHVDGEISKSWDRTGN